MPQNIDSYTTTSGSSVDTRPIVTAITEAVVTDDLDEKPETKLNVQGYGNYHPLFITGTYPSEAKIPPFAHPISVKIRGRNFISSDIRMLLKKEITADFDDRVRNRIDFEFGVSRVVLNMLWAGGRSGEFRTGFSFSALTFASWFCQVLKSGMGFETTDLVVIRVIALAYYYELCAEAGENNDKRKLVDWIFNLTEIDDRYLTTVIDKLKPMKNLGEFILNVKSIMDGLKVQKLNETIFITSLRSSWYGMDAEKILPVATEHPPTWTALVHHSLSTKGYKNCLISQISLEAAKRGAGDVFMRQYYDVLKNSIRLESFNQVGNFNPKIDDHFDYDGVKLSLEAEQRLPIL